MPSYSIVLRLLILALVAAPGLLRAAGFVIESPLDYQVFQRDASGSGKIVLRGRWSGAGTRVEARIENGKWTALRFNRVSGEFEGDLPARAGGFYKIETRVAGAGSAAHASVAHVGIGEVFVISGQSNATNNGEVRQVSKTRMVATFSGQDWRIADDPQPGVQDASNKGSFIPAFGDAMYEKYRVPVGVACVGFGATSVRQWLPKGDPVTIEPTMAKFVIPAAGGAWESDGTLYDGMMNRIRQLGPYGFRALLWHQGESDANQPAGHRITGDDYYRMLKRLIEATRRDAGWDFPWFVAQASYHNPADVTTPEIRDAQSRLWREGIALEGPDTDRLTREYREKNGEGVHLNAQGLEAHGRMWAEKVSAWLK